MRACELTDMPPLREEDGWDAEAGVAAAELGVMDELAFRRLIRPLGTSLESSFVGANRN